MRKTVKVEVTQQDIEAGVRVNPWACPIGRAAERAFGEPAGMASDILVGNNYYDVPPDVRRWVLDFDRGEPVEPITFVATPNEDKA